MHMTKLTPEQKRVISWLASTKSERYPKTLVGLAKVLGVKPSTISRWRTDLDLDARAIREIEERLFERLPEVYGILARKAEEGSSEHIELFLRVAADHSNGSDIKAADDRLEVAQRLAALLTETEG